MFDWWRRLSRAEVIAEPFPERFRELVRRRVPCAELLTEAEKTKLQQKMKELELQLEALGVKDQKKF